MIKYLKRKPNSESKSETKIDNFDSNNNDNNNNIDNLININSPINKKIKQQLCNNNNQTNNNNNNHNNTNTKPIKPKHPSYSRQHIIPNPPKPDYSKPLILPNGSNPNVILTLEHKKKLAEDGYCVIENVLNSSEVKQCQELFWDWMEELDTGIKRWDWSTWTNDRIPIQDRGIVHYPSITHSNFVWHVRCNPNIRSIFTQLWHDPKLLVGFCRARLLPPATITKDNGKRWYHVDQSSRRRGLHCIQGQINLVDSDETDPGLMVIPRSHLYHKDFFKIHNIGCSREWYKHSPEDLKWFYETKKLKEHKIVASAGSLILWDSRTIHCNRAATANQLNKDRPGMCVFVCYTPKKWCNQEVLIKKQEAFKKVAFTSHWPHVVPYTELNQPPFRTNGKDVSKFKNIQIEPPTLDKVGLELAGF